MTKPIRRIGAYMGGMWRMRGIEANETEFLGLHFSQMDETQALEWLLARSDEPTFSYVVTPNVDHMVQIYRDPDTLNHVYDEADLRLCDSRVMALMGRWNRLKLSVVTGSGLTARLFSKPLRSGTRIAVVGGNQRQWDWLVSTQPDAEFFVHQPPMGLRHNLEAQLEAAMFVEDTKADIVLITVGAPQSELVASLIHARGIARGVAICVGASLEFITGEKRRAPRWVQSMSMEWAFRLLCEPRRLARRYLVDGPRIFRIWTQWMRGGRPQPAPGVVVRPAAMLREKGAIMLDAIPAPLKLDLNGEQPFAAPVAAKVLRTALPKDKAHSLGKSA